MKKQSSKNQKTPRPSRPKLVLLDAHAIIHRAYHALPEFSSSKGEPTGALYGLAAMILRIAGDLKPDYIAGCFDLPQPTYRHQAYEGYKAKREKADEALVSQLKRAREVFEAFGIQVFEAPGFEADDILGTIAEQLRGEEIDIVIASGDMDTMQLTENGRVNVYTLKRGLNEVVLYDEDKVFERYGFGPKLLPDYKGLSGDPSDNIIGIAGIGEKTATALITSFGSIEDIYKKLAEDRGAFAEAGIKERVIKLLEEGEEEARFSKLLATIRKDAPVDFVLPKEKWLPSIDISKAEALFKELEFRNMVSRLKNLVNGKPEEKADAVAEKKSESFGAGTLFSNSELGEGELEELKIALWLVNSNITNPEPEDILAFAKTESLKDARKIIFERLAQQDGTRIFEEIEKPLIPVVRQMSKRGIGVDTDFLSKLSKEYQAELSLLEKSIFKMAGETFNLNSPKQLGEILFNKLGLKTARQKKTSTGAFTTKEEELLKLKDLHPIIPEILKYRGLQKLLSTYIDALPRFVEADGRIHPVFLQAGTTTGRMASKEPNIQNIPIKEGIGRRVRGAFTSAEGFSLVAFDYSQIELRIAAFLSGEEAFIDVFRRGEDVHNAVAAAVFDVPVDKVDPEMRRKAKVINFGILYGMGILALKQNLGTSKAEAEKFYSDYFAKFSGLAGFIEKVKKEAARKGYTETLFGRRRYFDGIKSRIPYIRAGAERMAVNAPIQGTSADIMKLAMVRASEFIKKHGLEEDVYLVLQIHDELVFEIKEDKVAEIAPKIREIMESVVSEEESRGVPIPVNVSRGSRWDDMSSL